MKKIHIAIDGPAGAGKSTISKLLAEKLKINYLDTGAMYRALTYHIINNNTNINDNNKIINEAQKIIINFNLNKIYLNNVDVTDAIRKPIVNKYVSSISKISEIRHIMVEQQRKIAEKESVVMDGRDIGTVVLPNANFKFYIDASIEERANRRYKEILAKGIETNLQDITNEIRTRDNNDLKREVSPLTKAKDAIVIDTTNKTINQVIEEIIFIINKKRKGD